MGELREKNEIAERIAGQFGMKLSDLKKKTNIARFVTARNMAYYILHCDYNVSLNDLCTLFDRTNREVCYRIAAAKEKFDKDTGFRKRHDMIVKKIQETSDM